MFALAALMLAATAVPAAPAYEPSFDPSRLKQTVAGEPGQALVLGSPHLSGFPKDFDAKALDALLTSTNEWQLLDVVVSTNDPMTWIDTNALPDVRNYRIKIPLSEP